LSDENKLHANISSQIREHLKELLPKQTISNVENHSLLSRFEQQRKGKPEVQIKKERRERMDRRDLEKLIFDLFSENTKLTFKEISDDTQQPKNYLEGVLKGICDVETSREGKFYVLKQEYRKKESPAPSDVVPEDVENLKEQPYKKFRMN